MELFHNPADPDVARFFGGCNFFEGRIKEGRFITEFGSFDANGSRGNGNKLTATIRPEDIVISAGANGGIAGRVERTNFEGITTRIWVRCRETEFVVLAPDTQFSSGQEVCLHLPAAKITIFI